MIQEPPRVHPALALSPVWNSKYVLVKLQLQLRLSPVAPLRGSDLCASFPNPQHASSQQLCLQSKLLQPYPTRHQLPPDPGMFCGWRVSQGPPVFPGLRVSLAATFRAGSGRGRGSAQLGEGRRIPRMLFDGKEGGIGSPRPPPSGSMGRAPEQAQVVPSGWGWSSQKEQSCGTRVGSGADGTRELLSALGAGLA